MHKDDISKISSQEIQHNYLIHILRVWNLPFILDYYWSCFTDYCVQRGENPGLK